MGLVDWFRRKRSPTPVTHSFHITIGSASKKQFDLENDLRMLRSALVYADQVKLCSTSMSHMYSVLNFSKDIKHFIAYLEEVYRSIPDGKRREKLAGKLELIREVLRKNPRQQEKNELLIMSRLKRSMQEQRDDVKAKYPPLANESEIKGVMKAVNSGTLELHTFESLRLETLMAVLHSGEIPNEQGITPSGHAIYEEYMETVAKAVTEGSTYPMFDDTTGQLVKARLDEKGESPSDIRWQRAKHGALADNLLERLPDFGNTPVDKILDIRAELQGSLDRFRGGISTYAAGMKSVPWNKDFADEANELFIQKVNPGILEIEDMVKSGSNPIMHMGREAIKAKAFIGGGAAIGFVVDTPDSLPKYVKMALGSVLPLGFAVGEGIKSYRNERRKPKAHTLYFYYRVGKKVKK